MDSLEALEDHETALDIRQYLETLEQNVHCERPDELSLPARLCSESLGFFQEVLHLVSDINDRLLPRPERISLERSFGQFKLWSDGFGVSNGELDSVLHRSKRLRRDVLKLLRSIAVTLIERESLSTIVVALVKLFNEATSNMMRVTGLVPQLFGKSSMTESLGRSSIELKAIIEAYHDDDDESTSSGDSTDSLEDNIQEMTKDLQTDTLCLMELSDLLGDPILDSIEETEKSVLKEALSDWELQQAFCEKVATRFPGATKLLVLRLGKANYERYIRCQQERETRKQITITEDSKSQSLHFAPHGSRLHDSALGSSIPSATSYAETLVS
jgi:hypothetical protein